MVERSAVTRRAELGGLAPGVTATVNVVLSPRVTAFGVAKPTAVGLVGPPCVPVTVMLSIPTSSSLPTALVVGLRRQGDANRCDQRRLTRARCRVCHIPGRNVREVSGRSDAVVHCHLLNRVVGGRIEVAQIVANVNRGEPGRVEVQ